MKSPWKFLVQLASGRRAGEGVRSTSESDAAKPVDPPPEAPVEVPVHSVTPDNGAGLVASAAKDVSDLDVETGDGSAVQLDAGEGTLAPSADSTTFDDHAVLPRRTHQSKPRSRPRKTRTTALPTNVAAEAVKHGDESSSNARPAPTFLEEVAELDEEINRLRYLLAEKLVLQNAQLEIMLKRFDAS